MSSAHVHPDFDRHPAKQWRAQLTELLPVLRREAYQTGSQKTDADRVADKDFCWRVLPRGAFVGMRVRADLWMRTEIRIARAEPLSNRAAWEKEVAVFCQQFEIRQLDGSTPADTDRCYLRITDHPNDIGKTVARLMELRPGEVEPEKALCSECLQRGERVVRPWFPGGGVRGQRCPGCAQQAGAEFTRQLRLV